MAFLAFRQLFLIFDQPLLKIEAWLGSSKSESEPESKCQVNHFKESILKLTKNHIHLPSFLFLCFRSSVSRWSIIKSKKVHSLISLLKDVPQWNEPTRKCHSETSLPLEIRTLLSGIWLSPWCRYGWWFEMIFLSFAIFFSRCNGFLGCVSTLRFQFWILIGSWGHSVIFIWQGRSFIGISTRFHLSWIRALFAIIGLP